MRGGSYLQEKHLFKSERIRTTIKHKLTTTTTKNWIETLAFPTFRALTQRAVSTDR